MEITPTFVLSIVINLVVVGIAWGKVQAKIEEICSGRKICQDRFKAIEENHSTAITDMRDEMKSISGALNQLIGKIDMFFAQQHLK